MFETSGVVSLRPARVETGPYKAKALSLRWRLAYPPLCGKLPFPVANHRVSLDTSGVKE